MRTRAQQVPHCARLPCCGWRIAVTLKRTARSLTVKGADDLSLNLLEWSSVGVPLLFVHGFGLAAHAWNLVAPHFADSYRVLCLDLRGHGESQHDPEYRYHHAAIGKDIAAVVSAMSLAPVILVAHSTAGHAAIGVAARFPEMVEALVLVEAGPDLHPAGTGVDQHPDARRSHFETVAQYEALLAQQHPDASQEILSKLAKHGTRPDPDGGFTRRLDPALYRPKTSKDPENRRQFDRRSWAARGEEALWRDLTRVLCRSLIVRGEKSRWFSSETEERMVMQVMVDARAAVVAGAGHNVMLDRPERLTRLLADFLTPD